MAQKNKLTGVTPENTQAIYHNIDPEYCFYYQERGYY